ncbi:Mannan endo-1,4-beta-mannosidase A, partial [Geodia barretti]
QEKLAGFIKLGSNQVHFQFTNKSTYYPVGENVCWVGENQGTYGYDDYFGKLAANGGNYARLWLTDSAWDDLAVEVKVGNMSLANTWRLDYVVKLAEKLNIHLLMCTESFNYFCTSSSGSKVVTCPSLIIIIILIFVFKAPCYWDQSYYNVANGGFLTKPSNFFTDGRAKADYKNRLRYLVARYGYSTSVFAWEFFNEVDICDDYNTAVQVEWNEEMSSYLRSLDVCNHLISTSFSNSNGDQTVQGLAALNFTMTHNYGSSDIAAATAQYASKKQMMYKKPSYVAEFGIGDEDNDKAGVSLHNGLWAPLFALGAGTSMSWWWDSWVDPNNLYPIFKPFSVFVSRLPLADYTWNVSDPTVSPAPPYNIRAWGMAGVGQGGQQLIVTWVQDDCFTWANQHSGVKCTSHSRLTLTTSCSGTSSGNYTGHWFNTHTGEDIGNTSVMCTGHLQDQIPTFSQDIAVYYTS